MSVMQALPGLLATPSFADLRRNMMHHTEGNPKIEKSIHWIDGWGWDVVVVEKMLGGKLLSERRMIEVMNDDDSDSFPKGYTHMQPAPTCCTS